MSLPDPVAAAQERAMGGGRRRRGPSGPTPDAPTYAGLVTRTLAFAIDAAIINVTSLAVSGVVALGLSVLYGTIALHDALVLGGGLLYAAWTAGYFIVLWAFGGQTIGNRVMQIRVVDATTGESLSVCRSALRLVGITLAAIPLLIGFLILLWDARRRALQDRLVHSVVVHVPRP